MIKGSFYAGLSNIFLNCHIHYEKLFLHNCTGVSTVFVHNVRRGQMSQVIVNKCTVK